jgi:hypothetical protein
MRAPGVIAYVLMWISRFAITAFLCSGLYSEGAHNATSELTALCAWPTIAMHKAGILLLMGGDEVFFNNSVINNFSILHFDNAICILREFRIMCYDQ